MAFSADVLHGPQESAIIRRHHRFCLRPSVAASITIDQVVFEPKHLIALLGQHSLPPDYRHELSVTATIEQEARDLLEHSFVTGLISSLYQRPRPS